jgi:phospholipid/cholesterol/gamma-HCH transport system substrate-binding protein
MPTNNKTSWARLRVGIMAMVALMIMGILVYLLSGSTGIFKSKSEIYVYMNDSADTAAGAPVRLNGILVGQVKSVSLSGSDQPGRVVKITLEIDERYMKQIPEDSQAQMAQPNILGTRYINIKKGQSKVPIKPGGELHSENAAELEDLFQQGDTTLAAMQDILKKADAIIDSIQNGQGTIGKLLVDNTLYDKFLSITTEAQKLIATVNSDQGSLGKLIRDPALYEDIRGSVDRINKMMDNIDQGQGTVGQLIKNPALYNNADAAIADLRKSIGDLNQILADLNAGKGTAGKLLKSDELSNKLNSTIARMDTMLDGINSGKGTIGQLMVNPSLYESIDGTTRELHGLLKDFRANPKKFLRIKLGLF